MVTYTTVLKIKIAYSNFEIETRRAVLISVTLPTAKGDPSLSSYYAYTCPHPLLYSIAGFRILPLALPKSSPVSYAVNPLNAAAD